MSPNSLDKIEKLRSWWWRRQGFDPATSFSSPAHVLKQSGWSRSVGGCAPYLTLFSRAGISREAADKAVEKLEIHELPSARACTYVVPADDYALALTLARGFGSGDMRVAEKLGVTQKEVDKLCVAVLGALKSGPLAPDDLRQSVGNAVRSLGAEGQKKGISSTLPLALGQMQRGGEIRRISTNGRLDNQRYQYALWRPNPLGKATLEPERAMAEIARRFFEWIAPAHLADFQSFAGISAKAAKAAVAALDLEPISAGDELLLPPALRSEFESFKPPKDPCYHLVTQLDSLLLLKQDVSVLLDPANHAHPLLGPKSARSDGRLMEFASPVIVDRGGIVGLWEYDPSTESIAYAVFGKKDALLKKAVAATEEYVRTQLGDARTFSLDSPKSRLPRIEALRA
jgi:hypothetical protein